MDELKKGKWGGVTCVKGQVADIDKYLRDYEPNLVADSLLYAAKNSNVSYSPLWSQKRKDRENEDASAKGDSSNEVLDLEAYILANYKASELKHMKKDGTFDLLQTQLEAEKFRLLNIAKSYKNRTFTTLFLFEACYMRLSNNLGGSTPQRKLESLQRWLKTLSDYDTNQGQMRDLLSKYNKRVAQW